MTEFPSRRWFKIDHEPAQSQGKIVNSHNTKTEHRVNNESVGTGTDSVRVLRMDLVDVGDLEIADDNPGGDPYNSTGQHVIIKSKLDLGD
jgi:hypothetical protein